MTRNLLDGLVDGAGESEVDLSGNERIKEGSRNPRSSRRRNVQEDKVKQPRPGRWRIKGRDAGTG